jgi:circadian clock protein KaiC
VPLKFNKIVTIYIFMERISTGVIGLDEQMEGGLIRGSITLVTGKTGTGKTAFCASFLYAGLLAKEPGLYVTTEEMEDDIKGDILAMFGWDLRHFEQAGLLKFLSIKPVFPSKAIGENINRLVKLYVFDLSEKIMSAIRSVKAKRVVIDSVSIVEMFIQDPYMSRVAIMSLAEKLKGLGVTAMLTGTVPEVSEALSGGGIVEFIVDCVIKLDFVPVAEEYKRTLTIRKMRRTDHSTLIHPFTITKGGLKLIPIK